MAFQKIKMSESLMMSKNRCNNYRLTPQFFSVTFTGIQNNIYASVTDSFYFSGSIYEVHVCKKHTNAGY